MNTPAAIHSPVSASDGGRRARGVGDLLIGRSQHQDLDDLARTRHSQGYGAGDTPMDGYQHAQATTRRTGPTRAPSPMMAGRAQGNTPGQQKQVQTTHFYRDLAPAPRSHTAPTDATSKRHESGLDLLQAVGNGLFQGVDESLHQVLPGPRSSARYAWTRALVDAPGGLDGGVTLDRRNSAQGRSAWKSVSRSASVRRVRLAR